MNRILASVILFRATIALQPLPALAGRVPRTHRGFQLGYALLLLGCLGSVGDAATLNLKFSNGADMFGWNLVPPAQVATAKMDIMQAAMIWQQAIPSTNVRNTFALDINVKWGPLPTIVCGIGSIDAVAGTRPTMGTVTLNSNLLGKFFFDKTPGDSTEFIASTIPGERWIGTANPKGPAAGKEDLISCAEHEFGHTLGYFYSAGAIFKPYKDELDANKTATGDYGIKTVDNPAVLLKTGQDKTDINSVSHWSPVGKVPGTEFLMANLLMAPDAIGDGRKFPSPYDVSALAKVLGLKKGDYDLNVSQPFLGEVVPEPSTFALAALGAVCLVGGLRRRSPPK